MTALARRTDAAVLVPEFRSSSASDRWHQAVKIRRAWLSHGLSTEPADRRAAEQALTSLYARISRPRPRFEWVASPAEAAPLVADLPTLTELHRLIRNARPPGVPAPAASDLAMIGARLRGSLSSSVGHADPALSPARKPKNGKPWPELPPLDAFRFGVPLGVVLHQGILGALHRSLAHGIRGPIRSAMGRSPISVCWYGQHDASWIAYYDVLQRLGLARYRPSDLDHFGDWATLTRTCGWWWPGDDVCIVVDRPEALRTEPVPGAWHDEVRLRPDGVRYRDGWSP